MCGIIGYTGGETAAPILLNGLKKLEYRGYDSAGIATAELEGLRVVKSSGMIQNLCEKVESGQPLTGSTGIGHTRWATHGAPTDTNAHPHLSNDGRFAIVHNGIIENYVSLREELIQSGFTFLSETDTEVIVHLLEMYYRGDFRRAVMKTAARLEGSYALGCICSDYPDTVIAVKESSPLIIGLGAGETFFASDVTALVSYTKSVIYLDDGELCELKPDGAKVYDLLGKPLDKPVSRVVWDIEAAEKGGYDHFMMKEIMEQPRALKNAIEHRIRDGKVVFEDVSLTDEDVRSINKIVITACGSAYYAGCAGKYTIEAMTHIPVITELASEFRYENPIVDGNTLVILLSQSGETADTIAALKEAKSRGARTLAIVNVVASTIAKLADDVIYTMAGPEIAVATTKGYTTQTAVLYLFAVYMSQKLGIIDDSETNRLLTEIKKLPSLIQRAIDLNRHVPYLAKKYCRNTSLFFIGRNTDYAACLEGSLKLKEISYIHSEAYAAGELKHGTITLIEPGRLVVALCCCERLFDKMLSNIKEVKARGAMVLGVAMEGCRSIFAETDDVITVPRADPLFSVIGEVVPLQIFAYYVAKENGCDIDKPKNLAKSVTVE